MEAVMVLALLEVLAEAGMLEEVMPAAAVVVRVQYPVEAEVALEDPDQMDCSLKALHRHGKHLYEEQSKNKKANR